MNDTQLYEQILGLTPPWRVAGVTLKKDLRQIEIEVVCDETVWACPKCRQRMHVHGSERRRWRHLDTCQFQTLVVADVPRVKCAAHGTQQVRVPWAEKYSRFTALFERFAIDVLLECSIRGACELLGISWEEADGIKQRAVDRGLARKTSAAPRRVCVDEKSFGRGHDYVTLVLAVDQGRAATVEQITEGRTRESLEAYWRTLTLEQRVAVEAISMDIWEPYAAATRACVPGAEHKIVHDPFHLLRHMNEAVNDVRKSEHRALRKLGDTRLAGSKQLWLYGWENVPDRWGRRLDELRGQKLKTSRAWALKELFRDFWTCPTVEQARAFFARWYAWAIRSRLGAVKRVARMFRRHLEQILTYFTHRLTNAAAEGMNNRVQSLIAKAYGYRNRERFKRDILFHAGGLQLYPVWLQ